MVPSRSGGLVTTSRLLSAIPLSIAALLSFVACGDPPATTTASASGAKPARTASARPGASAAPSASASAAAEATRGGMSHCPNAVEGAKVDIQDDPKGVVMTITAADKRGTEAIRERAKWVDGKAKAEVGKIQHTGEGGGGGVLGRCPVVLKGTEVTVADVEGGTKVTMLVADAKEVDWLRREVRERQTKITEPGGAAQGQRKMANCPSAVEGASTAIAEKGGAVVVTVTARGDEAIGDVRARAKKLVDASKAGDSDKHDGNGAGAGTGRCPVVLEDTTIALKDVEGGAEIAITPVKGGDLAKVAKEAKERNERFTAGAALAPAPSASAAPAAGSARP